MRKLILLIITVVMLVLCAASVSAADDKITLVLDPGHGGNDPGTTVGTRYESEYNYDIALLLKEKLEATGDFTVYLTRGRGENKVYLLRSAVADQYNADMLISLHFNSNAEMDPTLNGVEVLASVLDEWCPDALAESICASISKKCGLENGGVIKKYDTGDSRGIYYWNEEIGWDVPGTGVGRVSDYYSMLSWGTKLGFPAIIVEHAYLSNASDLAFCDSKEGLEKLASAEAEAIIKYFTGHTHTYAAETCDRRANCCLGGVYSQKCTSCGHRINVRRTEPSPSVHAWTVESKAVTCTEDGYVHRECQISRNLSEKGYNYVTVHTESETYPATGHSLYTEVDTPASHAVNGLFREVCTTCGEVFETVRYGDPHIYVNIESAAATCESTGYDKYMCTVCEDTYTDDHPAIGHAYEADGEALSCASDGTKEYTCTNCGDVVSENIELPPHSFEVTEEVSRSCETDGKRVTRCSVCGLENIEVFPATGHAYPAEGEERVIADYFTEGEMVFVCANDASHEYTEAIPKRPGGIYIMIGAVAAVVAVITAIVFVFVTAAKKRLHAISCEVTAELEDISEKEDKVPVITEEEKRDFDNIKQNKT